MKINYSDTEVKRVSPGEYDVFICAWDVKTTSSGSQMLTLDYEIRKDVIQESGGQRVKFDNFVFTENAEWKINAIAKVVGVPEGYDVSSAEALGGILMHRNLRITLTEREYNGKQYMNTTGYAVSLNQMPQPELPSADGFMPIPDSVEDKGLPFN
jgi:Protein of unknown function (DUF669).